MYPCICVHVCMQIVDKHGYKAPFLYHATMVLAKGLSLNLELLTSVKLSCVENPWCQAAPTPVGTWGYKHPLWLLFVGTRELDSGANCLGRSTLTINSSPQSLGQLYMLTI